jgi:hypothetical protein
MSVNFDKQRVRIELCDVMVFTDGLLTRKQAAEIWLADGRGKITRSPKPAVRLVGSSRAELLRQLATWIDQQDDAGLTALAAQAAETTP